MAMHWLRKLYVQVLIGIALGVAVAALDPEWGVAMKPLGDGFIKLIKMLIAPIIFCTVVTGIAHVGDIKRAGRLGLKAIVYFEIVTTLALIGGLLIGNFTQLGAGMHVDVGTLDATALNAYGGTHPQASQGTVDFLMSLLPQSFFSGVVMGDLLQTLTAGILFAWALMGLKPQYRDPVLGLVESVAQLFFRIVEIVMHLAPIGAFGAIAYTIGKLGLGSLGELVQFVVAFFAACLAFVLFVLGPILHVLTGLSVLKLIHYIREELFIVLGTSSSETVLPRLLTKMEALGCERQVVGMVLPTGYSFNLDGSSLYFTMALMFLAHATGTTLDIGDQISILLVLLITSKGSAGVTGSAFIVLVGTLAATHTVPVASAAIILGIDRFMSTGRALTNVVGNCIATLVVARMEKELDVTKARHVLSAA
ncbi:MAG: C4-dicarboxylate transporter DctA [Rickettsiales bacterium]